MNQVIQISKEFKKFFDIKDGIYIHGWLSSVDYDNGNWNTSIPFYEGVALKNNVGVIFRKNKIEYTSAEDFLDNTEGKDGRVIFCV